ncbi:MAG: hypothetical protein AB7V18_09765 [Pyrinomonadaceae bacterium]
MFETRQKQNWNYTWPGIFGVVIIIIAVFQIVRVNPPDRPVGDTENRKVWTEGELLRGRAVVPANGYLSFPLNLNRRANFSAVFTTGRSEVRIVSAIIRAEDFNMWKSGEDVEPVSTTGKVPRGVVKRVLEPGMYLFVLDNRAGDAEIVLEDTEIKVD